MIHGQLDKINKKFDLLGRNEGGWSSYDQKLIAHGCENAAGVIR
jgi:hypothetical protein